jgi:hypothetical protein
MKNAQVAFPTDFDCSTIEKGGFARWRDARQHFGELCNQFVVICVGDSGLLYIAAPSPREPS